MIRISLPTLLLTLPAVACFVACSGGGDAQAESSESSAEEAAPAKDPMQALHENIGTTAARAEIDAETIKVVHILVAFKGADRSKATRSKEEAEVRAAELFARVVAGEDFLALMKDNSDDSGPGIYGMTMGTQKAGYHPRDKMATAFGDTGWRLEVDQVGVAPHDAVKSRFGWHIIKRIE